jgi:hypothetical protein
LQPLSISSPLVSRQELHVNTFQGRFEWTISLLATHNPQQLIDTKHLWLHFCFSLHSHLIVWGSWEEKNIANIDHREMLTWI